MRRTLQVLAVAIAAALVLELGLQVGHGIVIWRYGRSSGPADGQGRLTVLCIGDSFTFGSGAASPQGSYPMALQRILERELGSGVRVVNAGWPGQNSFTVASQLHSQIAASAPDYVLALVGSNDTWKHAELFVPSSQHGGAAPSGPARVGGFRLEWRTLRLFQLLRQRLAPVDDPPASALSPPPPPPPPEVPQPRRATTAAPVSKPDKPTRIARRLMSENDYAAALAVATDGLTTQPDRWLELEILRIDCLVRLGRRAEARAEVDIVQALYEEQQTTERAEALVSALDKVGERERALELAQERVKDHPDSPQAWRVIATSARLQGDHERSAWAFEQMLELDIDPSWKATVARELSGALKRSDPERGVRLLVDAMLRDGRVDASAARLRLLKIQRPTEVVAAYVATLDLDQHGRDLVESLQRELATGDWGPPLRENLEQIVAMARRAGATPVVLGYPTSNERLHSLQEEVARETGTPFVRTIDRFRKELESRARETLFVADGHCTATGYAILAEEAARTILELERPSSS